MRRRSRWRPERQNDDSHNRYLSSLPACFSTPLCHRSSLRSLNLMLTKHQHTPHHHQPQSDCMPGLCFGLILVGSRIAHICSPFLIRFCSLYLILSFSPLSGFRLTLPLSSYLHPSAPLSPLSPHQSSLTHPIRTSCSLVHLHAWSLWSLHSR